MAVVQPIPGTYYDIVVSTADAVATAAETAGWTGVDCLSIWTLRVLCEEVSKIVHFRPIYLLIGSESVGNIVKSSAFFVNERHVKG